MKGPQSDRQFNQLPLKTGWMTIDIEKRAHAVILLEAVLY
jgi:hypothetical protein